MANFFERMERKLNLHTEYMKIEEMVLNEPGNGYPTVESYIEKYFRKWRYRKNYTSFYELRQQMGFEYEKTYDYNDYYVPTCRQVKTQDFLLYCEMILNMWEGVLKENLTIQKLREIMLDVIQTIMYDLGEINHEARRLSDGKVLVVQKDAAVTAVADIVTPDLADALVEYNHHLLKGNIEAKKVILKKLADALEPRRAELKAINKTVESDFFYMVNTMNVRHNNCDPKDPGKYVQKFAVLTPGEQEKWYDDIYQQGLVAYMLLEQEKREKRISAYKQS